MDKHPVFYRALGCDFTMSGGAAHDWREALEVAGGSIGSGACLVEFMGCDCGGRVWAVSLLPLEKSPRCVECNGLVHVVMTENKFWCPVCEPDGL